eukprot:2542324-Prymnesium_polylepis.1
MARPMLLVELRDGAPPEAQRTRDALLVALAAANASQPPYSHVLPEHVLLLTPSDGALPLTVKGNVQRRRAEEEFA